MADKPILLFSMGAAPSLDPPITVVGCRMADVVPFILPSDPDKHLPAVEPPAEGPEDAEDEEA